MEKSQVGVLEVSGITKAYKSVPALKGIDLRVNLGECLAVLGPNGAGKTTLLDIVTGLTSPDEGRVVLFGEGLSPKSRRRMAERIGVVLQETNLYKRYTILETLRLFASFYKNPGREDELLAKLGLEGKKKQQLRHLSGGERQRVHLACALVHSPDLVFLDEPTTGLDPKARRELWDLILELKKEGKSILLTTHYMEEASQLADRIVILDHGRIVLSGTPRELLKLIKKENPTLEDVFMHVTGRGKKDEF